MPLSDIVNVVITRNTQGIPEPGFGILMILGTSKRFNERIRFYSSMDEVASDFAPSDPEYIAAQDTFAQPVSPQQIAIGRREANDADISVITASLGSAYNVIINGLPITITSETPSTFNSTIVMSADFVTGNSIATTLNGNALTAVPFTNNQVDTMNAWAAVISAAPNIQSVTVSQADPNTRTLIVTANPGFSADFTPIPVVTGGASQPVAAVTPSPQPVSIGSIVAQLVVAINAQSGNTGVSAVNNGDGTITLSATTSGVPYTLDVTTNITNASSYLVSVTQAFGNRDYTLTINGEATTITTSSSVQSNQQIAAQLVTAVNANMTALGIPVRAVDNANGTITVAHTTPGSGFSLRVSEGIMRSQFGLAIDVIEPSGSVTDDLDAINNENNTWYALATTSRDKATVLSIAGWVESRVKLFGTASAESDIINVAPGLDTTSIAAQLSILGYARTFVMYHQDAGADYPEAAWFGRVLPLEPGSETWKFKTLNGVTYSALTTTQSNNALGKNANTYENIAGRSFTQNGTVAVGEFIDIIRGIDWLTSTIQIYVFQVLVNNNKVPYTDAGIAVIEAEVRRALQQGIDQQFIAEDPAPIVTVPKAANVPTNDKANRILRNVRFQATLSGAIHAVDIRGVVTV